MKTHARTLCKLAAASVALAVSASAVDLPAPLSPVRNSSAACSNAPIGIKGLAKALATAACPYSMPGRL